MVPGSRPRQRLLRRLNVLAVLGARPEGAVAAAGTSRRDGRVSGSAGRRGVEAPTGGEGVAAAWEGRLSKGPVRRRLGGGGGDGDGGSRLRGNRCPDITSGRWGSDPRTRCHGPRGLRPRLWASVCRGAEGSGVRDGALFSKAPRTRCLRDLRERGPPLCPSPGALLQKEP